MINPFVETEVDEEKTLVERAQAGDGGAFERLIRLHQRWVFNIVLRMVADYHQAEDVSQEVLLKAFAKISTFKGKSRFRTWLYRIAVNTVLNMKKTKREELHERCGHRWADDRYVEDYISQGLPDRKFAPAEAGALAGEVMVKCLLGMLLCLNRRQRIVYILGAVLGVNGRVAGRIVGLSEANFRQLLSRARRRLWNFLNERCSLVNPDKPCSCAGSVPAAVARGYVDPLKLIFTSGDAPRIRDIVSKAREKLDHLRYEQCRALYREHPFQEGPDFSVKLVKILESEAFRGLVDP